MTFSPLESFLKQAESDSGVAKLLRAKPGALVPEIAEAAQPFVAALLIRKMKGRVWVVCRDVKGQEEFAAELAAWCERVRLFPDLEMPNAEALPDAETESERLDLLRTLARSAGDEVVVIHAGQWDSVTPALGSVKREVFILEKEQSIPLEDVISRLETSG
jgi:transcription-repair coupling factor (superfamily II helicase)